MGNVLKRLREHQLEEKTLVFFYSDNGGPTWQTTSRNDPLRGFKGEMFEGGIRVPFLVQWKGTLPAGAVYREMVMGFDVHATALAAAGLTVPPSGESGPAHTATTNLDGANLIPYLTGENQGRPHEQLSWRSGQSHAARVGDWKLVRDPRQGESDMLFHLKDDTSEKNDLAGSQPEKLKELQLAFAECEKGTQPAKWIRQDARNAELGGELKPEAERTRARRPRAGRSSGRIGEAFKSADQNKDGRLSRDEYPRPEIFPTVDANGDGFATPEEVRAYFRNRRNRRTSAP